MWYQRIIFCSYIESSSTQINMPVNANAGFFLNISKSLNLWTESFSGFLLIHQSTTQQIKIIQYRILKFKTKWKLVKFKSLKINHFPLHQAAGVWIVLNCSLQYKLWPRYNHFRGFCNDTVTAITAPLALIAHIFPQYQDLKRKKVILY